MAEQDSTRAKPCTRCAVAKPATLEFFPPHPMGRYGLHPFCRPCKKIDDAVRRQRPDQKARQQTWRDANKDYTRRYNKRYRDDGYSSTRHVSEWRSKNIERARRRERETMRRRRKEPAFVIKARMSARLRSILKHKKGRNSTETILGYTRGELRAHLEKQFTKGMTWARFMAGEIEIDHIIPVVAFGVREIGDAEFRACWALTNLRPLWKADNLKKNAKILNLL